MLYINYQHLISNLNTQLNLFYLILGKENILIEESTKLIIQTAYKKEYTKKFFFILEKESDWLKIFFILKNKLLFNNKKVIIIIIKKNNVYNQLINNLKKIFNLISSDTIIIINYYSWSIQYNSYKLNNFNTLGTIVNCSSLNNNQLKKWINFKIKSNKITIENQAKLILCKYYLNNLLELKQIIDIICLLWPNSYVTTLQIKKIINNSTNFSILNWIDAILSNQKKESLKILNNLIKNKFHPLMLIKALTNNLLILINMKRQNKISFNAFLQKNKVYKNRYCLFINACKKCTNTQLYKMIHIILLIETSIKKNINISIDNKLEDLSLILF
ncbi:DNA polymerase III delta subunit [Buchnera aphidicola (Nipponaphis monzeni)]|uniref:DNA polymerase III subunit delta n=1 Tax=Buchnera aphidicola (Nipponaphis monzeni) TaxID=2495405 RepID=A0A455TAF8_9GAMM|nr:DNA polymerase III subunit delta [Buchnera aphidicola]BBI01341.1 DNA polymerase III delta subunit [Buchnera aphidicola (Nipponaphis monzeni)]